MNVEIGAEAALFPEKEYINGIAVVVHDERCLQYLKAPTRIVSSLVRGQSEKCLLHFLTVFKT
jgi:hypothetical protein